MEKSQLYVHIDHTLLKPTATWEQVKVLCEEAVKYHTASVCIPPCYVKQVRQQFPQLTIGTVIGFPNGYHTTHIKVAETLEAIANGADEIDMVIHQGAVKEGRFVQIKEEIEAVKEACQGRVLKVIVETCNLTEGEKITLCHVVTEAKADYIKTSTGFGESGATFADIALFREFIGPDVKMKAAGGVQSREDIEKFIELGCERIGTSKAVALLAEEESE